MKKLLIILLGTVLLTSACEKKVDDFKVSTGEYLINSANGKTVIKTSVKNDGENTIKIIKVSLDILDKDGKSIQKTNIDVEKTLEKNESFDIKKELAKEISGAKKVKTTVERVKIEK